MSLELDTLLLRLDIPDLYHLNPVVRGEYTKDVRTLEFETDKFWLSGDHATEVTLAASWKTACDRWLLQFQIRTVWSKAPLANSSSSGLNATENTLSVCPLSVAEQEPETRRGQISTPNSLIRLTRHLHRRSIVRSRIYVRDGGTAPSATLQILIVSSSEPEAT